MPPRPWIAIVGLLTACASPAAPSPSASPSALAAPSASQAAEGSGSSLVFEWPDGEAPAVTRELTGIERNFINPGAVIEHEGTLHMFANVFSAWPGEVHVPHLTSSDGVSWELAAEEPIMTSADVPFASPGHDVSTGFVTSDGVWVLVLQSVNSTEPWEIGLATAPGPAGPWTIAPQPVLTAGAAGSADAAGLAWPSVVATDNGYAMYYTARTGGLRGGTVAMATSSDGLTWAKSDEPVLTAEADWEGLILDRPRVARTPDGFVMLYAGGTLTDRGVAWSDDGVTWTRDGDAPAITAEDFPVPGQAWDAALVHRGGELTYYLEIGFGAGAGAGTKVYRATAQLP
jgi:predicted GH43/DUF377 family glycosyl hydrolase